MSKFGVWAYCYFGNIEAETQAEAQTKAEWLVDQITDVQVNGSVDVIPDAEDDAGGVCC